MLLVIMILAIVLLSLGACWLEIQYPTKGTKAWKFKQRERERKVNAFLRRIEGRDNNGGLHLLYDGDPGTTV